MHNVMGQSKQLHSSLGVFVRVYLISIIRFITKKTHKKYTCTDSHNKSVIT